MVSYFDVHDAFEHLFKSIQLVLPFLLFLLGVVFQQFVVKSFLERSFLYLGPAQRASLVDEIALTDALFAENMFTIGFHGIVQGIVTD